MDCYSDGEEFSYDGKYSECHSEYTFQDDSIEEACLSEDAYDSEHSFDIDGSFDIQRCHNDGESMGHELHFDSPVYPCPPCEPLLYEQHSRTQGRTAASYLQEGASRPQNGTFYASHVLPYQGAPSATVNHTVNERRYHSHYKLSSEATPHKEINHDCAHVEIPTFSGSNDIDEYLFWLLEVDRVMDSLPYSEYAKCKLVVKSLKGLAKLWWEGVQILRTCQGLKKITSWATMRSILQESFHSETYRKHQRHLLAHCSQGKRCISDYADEFEVLAFRSSLREDPNECIDQFIRGMSPKIALQVKKRSFLTFYDTVLYALKVEKRILRQNRKSTLHSTISQFQQEAPQVRHPKPDSILPLHLKQSKEPCVSISLQCIEIGTLLIPLELRSSSDCTDIPRELMPSPTTLLSPKANMLHDNQLVPLPSSFKEGSQLAETGANKTTTDCCPSEVVQSIQGDELIVTLSLKEHFGGKDLVFSSPTPFLTWSGFIFLLGFVQGQFWVPSYNTLRLSSTTANIESESLMGSLAEPFATHCQSVDHSWKDPSCELGNYHLALIVQTKSSNVAVCKEPFSSTKTQHGAVGFSHINNLKCFPRWDKREYNFITRVDRKLHLPTNVELQSPAFVLHISKTFAAMQTMLQSFEIASGQHVEHEGQIPDFECHDTTWFLPIAPICELNRCENKHTLQAETVNGREKQCALQDGIYRYYHMNGD